MDIKSLVSLGKKITRGNEERDIVGYIDCRCSAVATVLRGKAQLYEHCPECGLKMANGKKNTEYLYKNMRSTVEPVKAEEPTIKAEQPVKAEEQRVIIKRSILEKILGIELFTL